MDMYDMRIENEMFERVQNETPISYDDLRALMHRNPDKTYFVFPEDRTWPIYMTDTIPSRWKDRTPGHSFSGQAQPGEFYTFQLAVYACRMKLENIGIEFSDLVSESGSRINAEAFKCFNLGGIDCFGRPFSKNITVPTGKLQTLWIGVQIPENAERTIYKGEIKIKPEDLPETSIEIDLSVDGEVLADGGVSEPWRHSRLKWLDSTIAIDDGITAPYVPVSQEGSTIKYLCRETTLNADGLPASLVSFVNDTIDGLTEDGREILAAPVKFCVVSDNGEVAWRDSKFSMGEKSDAKVCWHNEKSSDELVLKCDGWVEYDGFTGYRITLKALKTTSLKDVYLEVPFRRDVAVYAMGLGHKGGYRPASVDWKWEMTLNQDTLWMGDVNAGLMIRLLGPEYEKPHMLFYYVNKPLKMPKAWFNEGKGGCTVREEENDRVVFRAYSGDRILEEGCELHFYFDLMVTPVKFINREEHWNCRYYHSIPKKVEDVVKAGANVINVHHGKAMSPFINYPFIEHEALAEFVKECHKHGIKTKLYYTVKELTYRMVELFAFKSLNGEIIAEGNGVGFFRYMQEQDEWLAKYLGPNFIPAWKSRLKNEKYNGVMEASVVVNPMSRYNNYYLEDINWMLENTNIDGLYFDDVAYDRTILRRVRKVLDRHHEGCMIDLHSWNYFKNNTIDDSRLAGWGNSVNLYIDGFPYIDRMWFGEGFDYDETPDFWLIEMSGIPFGMMGEMLQNGGNSYRGMVYGMTGRLPSVDPTGLWKLWDEFGILDARMLGYWNSNCPVRMSRPDVLATVYAKKDKAMIAAASWADGDVEARLVIDWDALGLDPAKTRLEVPEIHCFQSAQNFDINDSIPFEKGKGWIFILTQE